MVLRILFFYCYRYNTHRILHTSKYCKTSANTANLKPNVPQRYIVICRFEHPLLRSTISRRILHQNDHFRGRIQRFRAFLVPESAILSRHIISGRPLLFQRPDVNKIVKSGWIGLFHEQ